MFHPPKKLFAAMMAAVTIGLHSKQPMLPFGIGCAAVNVEDGVHKLCLLLLTHRLYTKEHKHFEVAKRGHTRNKLKSPRTPGQGMHLRTVPTSYHNRLVPIKTQEPFGPKNSCASFTM